MFHHSCGDESDSHKAIIPNDSVQEPWTSDRCVEGLVQGTFLVPEYADLLVYSVASHWVSSALDLCLFFVPGRGYFQILCRHVSIF